MACFIVPATEAVVTTVATKIAKSHEEKVKAETMDANVVAEMEGKIPLSKKLSWLSGLLWGGSALLAFEHVWHGEVTPWFPFLTAASDPADTAVMLHEMSTIGVTMAVLVTLVWVAMLGVVSVIEKREEKAHPAKN